MIAAGQEVFDFFWGLHLGNSGIVYIHSFHHGGKVALGEKGGDSGCTPLIMYPCGLFLFFVIKVTHASYIFPKPIIL